MCDNYFCKHLKTIRFQIFVVVAALALVGVLFSLPKIIINKDKKNSLSGTAATANRDVAAGGDKGHGEAGHVHEGEDEAAAAHATVTPEQLSELNTLRKKYEQENNATTKLSLANELAGKYAAASKYDSAGYYYEVVAAARPGEKIFQKAADQYFEAFSFSATEDRAKSLGVKARSLYEKVLKNNPSNLDAKTNMAMTYIALGEAPMQGIGLLREVLAADPNNEKAVFNLGILSIQSGQYDKAVERFEHLVEVNPKHVQGNFYLAVSLAQVGKKEEARRVFLNAKKLDADPGFQASIDTELAKLK
ncbi:tetratricopeptide repeat protein [Adhaeribacter aquaticus]|uniref:tetratricopeptide repeat protein n=1 Tax=Adhaeribacter aquaticus TaxID=299567 RepID=UPI001FE164E5|nr:tetratricopeptide repeat protein [Adhaeribacter aquaticus]